MISSSFSEEMSIFDMIHGYLIPYFPSSSVLIVLMCGSVKKDGKGVDILASLCNKYQTSEDELRKIMEKANNLIADILSKKPQPASDCRIGNLENIDTGTHTHTHTHTYRL